MLKSYIPFTYIVHSQYIPDSTAVLFISITYLGLHTLYTPGILVALYISLTYLGLHNLYIPDFISDCTYRLHTLDYIPFSYLVLLVIAHTNYIPGSTHPLHTKYSIVALYNYIVYIPWITYPLHTLLLDFISDCPYHLHT